MSQVITATNLGISQESTHSKSNNSSSGSSQLGIISNINIVNISKSRADGGKIMVEAAGTVCGVHITRQRSIIMPTAVFNSTMPAATLM